MEAVDRRGDAPAATALRVVIVDGHESLRTSLRELIDDQPDMSVVAEAATAHDGLTAVARTGADVVVIDASLPDRSGVDLCREVCRRCPSTRVLLLSSSDADEALFAAAQAGAGGYVVKHATGLDLANRVRRTARGQSLLDDLVLERLRTWRRVASQRSTRTL